MNIQPLLDNLSKYINLSVEEENNLRSKVKYRKYLKNQYLVQAGDVCYYTSYVISGCTKTFFIDDEGQEHIVMFSA
ncbi:MAG: Crp/Fnr family transcriptional regulator, partial [Aureibaculum sp.]